MILIAFWMIRFPINDLVLPNERFATVGTTRRYLLKITFGMIRSSIMYIEASIAYRFVAGGTDEMFRVPCSTQSRNIVAKDEVPALFTDWL